jgi:hypothetical protein
MRREEEIQEIPRSEEVCQTREEEGGWQETLSVGLATDVDPVRFGVAGIFRPFHLPVAATVGASN